MALTDIQRAVTKAGLNAARDFGFALAGSGALIEHGISTRLTDDADWFSTFDNAAGFDSAADAVITKLRADGFTISTRKRDATFFGFVATNPAGETVSVDMSLDWRRYNPAEISIGPVLDLL
ncbi:hypothetical protein [Rhodoglobus vestalii]|uniref:hypothetical protein n=1 Tax=Rhodoglobus vestalii TaxID=193384 RepID=UPI0011518284|nr:hypothetical protein [Rhodoglobus vestalii]